MELHDRDLFSTQTFSTQEDREKEIKGILSIVYEALKEKGYDPVSQLVGYVLTEDPTYITNYNNARPLISRVDREELLRILVKQYIKDLKK